MARPTKGRSLMASGGRRRFGNVRKLPSGRWQVRYRGPDGRTRPAPQTFERKASAERYLSLLGSQMASDEWTDTSRGRVRVVDYAEQWIEQRPGLRPRTVALYRWILRKHVTPYLGNVQLVKLDTPMIRQWRVDLLGNGVSVSMTAKAYRFLRTVLMTAMQEDRLIARNPCRIPGADQEKAPERPVLSMAEVFRLADTVPDRYRAMILLAAFSGLRYGEAIALERCDVNTTSHTVRVRQAYTEVSGQGLVPGPPKSRAGRRVVALPRAIVSDIETHLSRYVGFAPSALVFTGPAGKPNPARELQQAHQVEGRRAGYRAAGSPLP